MIFRIHKNIQTKQNYFISFKSKLQLKKAVHLLIEKQTSQPNKGRIFRNKIQFLKVNLTSLVSVLKECEEKMYYDDDDGGKYHIIILRLGSCIYSK